MLLVVSSVGMIVGWHLHGGSFKSQFSRSDAVDNAGTTDNTVILDYTKMKHTLDYEARGGGRGVEDNSEAKDIHIEWL